MPTATALGPRLGVLPQKRRALSLLLERGLQDGGLLAAAQRAEPLLSLRLDLEVDALEVEPLHGAARVVTADHVAERYPLAEAVRRLVLVRHVFLRVRVGLESDVNM